MTHERFYVLVGVGVLLAGLALFTVSSISRNQSDAKLDGQLCLLYELRAHRNNTYAADRDAALRAGVPFNVPAPPPTEVSPRQLEEACGRFFNR